MFYVKSTNGVKIAVYEYNPTGRETVLLIHGWPLSHKIFEYQTELLTEYGYRTVAVDLRGFGESDGPSYGYGYDQMATDIYNVVCALSLRKFTLTGFSMGGAIALRYMNIYNGYGVKKLILLAAAAPCWTKRKGFPYGIPRETAEQLIVQARTDRAQLAETFSHRQLFACPQSEAAKDWFADIALSASGVGTVQSAFSLLAEDGRQDLTHVPVPTWIIYGEKDVVVPKDLIRIQQESIPGSRLICLPDSGHGIMYDQLELFNAHFLKALKSGV